MMRPLLLPDLFLLAAALVPFLAACALLWSRIPDRAINALLRFGPLPALVAVIIATPHAPIDLPWLLTGVRLELTDVTRIFLLFTSLLWTIAGWYAVRYTAHDERRRRFAFYFLLSMTGNMGLIIAADIPGFYASFALMTFAAYGLVVHTQTPEAVRAGRIYIAMALLGEVMILTAILLIAFTGESLLIREAMVHLPDSAVTPWVIGLVLFGFGVKAGLLPVHGWLPLAHPVAPTPASAVLSGAMIKAGLLGWILFLPGGHDSYPVWGAWMIGLGLLAAFYAAAVGLTQSNPKTNLAYSSISQMGVMTVCMGIGLSDAADWSTAVLITSIYALNHAFAKGALFLGVGVALSEARRSRRHDLIILGGLALAALAIAGAPMTGGALAKRALKYFASSAPHEWGAPLDVLLPLTALATTVLLARFLQLVHRRLSDRHRTPDAHTHLMPSWAMNLLAVAFMAWFTILHLQVPISTSPFTWNDLVKSGVPIVGGIVLAILVYRNRPHPVRTIAPGDVVVPFEWLAGIIASLWRRQVSGPLEKRHLTITPILHYLIPEQEESDPIRHYDVRIRRFEVTGAFFIILLSLFVLTLMWR